LCGFKSLTIALPVLCIRDGEMNSTELTQLCTFRWKIFLNCVF